MGFIGSVMAGCIAGCFFYEAIKTKESDGVLLLSLGFFSVVVGCLSGYFL